MSTCSITQPVSPGLHIEKRSHRGVTCLELSGVLDDGFDGARLGRAITTPGLAVRLAQVRRVTTSGVRAWQEFVRAAAHTARFIAIAECAPAIIDQVNANPDVLGPARIVSFYARYECPTCGSRSRVLLDTEADRDLIARCAPEPKICPRCGDSQFLADDPREYFRFATRQRPTGRAAPRRRFAFTSLAGARARCPEAATLARVEPGLRADKTVVDRCTYLRLSGVLDAFFPYAKLADGLEGTVILDLADVHRVHATGAIAWRRFLRTVIPLADRTYLLGVPPQLAEEMTCMPEFDRGARVLTLELPYRCAGCATTSHHFVATDRHHADLARGDAPALACPDCGDAMDSAASPSFLACLACLPPVATPRRVARALRLVHHRGRGPGADPTPAPRSGFPALAAAATVAVAATAAAVAVVALGW